MRRLLVALLVAGLGLACSTTGAAVEPTGASPPADAGGDDSEGSSGGDETSAAEADDPSIRRVIRGAHIVGLGVADLAFAEGVIQEIAASGAIEAGADDVI
ncbi:MAG: hypothetical protein KC486_33525, partial [Myxococcales bacterium]|nr:hypothetical protein [Myxococcales bacterium]